MQPCKHPGQCVGWSSALLGLPALAKGKGFRMPGGGGEDLDPPSPVHPEACLGLQPCSGSLCSQESFACQAVNSFK